MCKRIVPPENGSAQVKTTSIIASQPQTEGSSLPPLAKPGDIAKNGYLPGNGNAKAGPASAHSLLIGPIRTTTIPGFFWSKPYAKRDSPSMLSQGEPNPESVNTEATSDPPVPREPDPHPPSPQRPTNTAYINKLPRIQKSLLP
jgi:hypothetical protein